MSMTTRPSSPLGRTWRPAGRQVGRAIGVTVLVAVMGAGRVAADYRRAWLLVATCGMLAASAALALRPPPS
jgi:hypothetical protein